MWNLLFLLPAIFTGAILIASVVSGEAINSLRGSWPLIIKRSEAPREYWAGVFVEVLWFAFAAIWGATMALG